MVSQEDDRGGDVDQVRAEAFLLFVRFGQDALNLPSGTRKQRVTGLTVPSVGCKNRKTCGDLRAQRCCSAYVK